MAPNELPTLNVEQAAYAEGIIPPWLTMDDLTQDTHIIDVLDCRQFYIRRMQLLLDRSNEDPLDATQTVGFPADDGKATRERLLQATLQKDLVMQARLRYATRYGSEETTKPAIRAALSLLNEAQLGASFPVEYARKGDRSSSRNAYAIEVSDAAAVE